MDFAVSSHMHLYTNVCACRLNIFELCVFIYPDMIKDVSKK